MKVYIYASKYAWSDNITYTASSFKYESDEDAIHVPLKEVYISLNDVFFDVNQAIEEEAERFRLSQIEKKKKELEALEK